MSSTLPDETLMLIYRDGDINAFQELYRRHSRGLYMFILWRSPRREWVDEITQETWGSLHDARARYVAQATFRTYLFQIARNKLIDQLRLHRHTLLASELGRSDEGDAYFDEVVNAEQAVDTAEEKMDSKQRLAWLNTAIKALPSEQREALALQHFSGMSLEEIAQVTVTPVETVKSRLRYAMRKLRQLAEPIANSMDEANAAEEIQHD